MAEVQVRPGRCSRVSPARLLSFESRCATPYIAGLIIALIVAGCLGDGFTPGRALQALILSGFVLFVFAGGKISQRKDD